MINACRILGGTPLRKCPLGKIEKEMEREHLDGL
jgi:hypothetical protein